MADNEKTKVVILGSTGSIGIQALQVIDLHRDKFQVIGLAAKDELNSIKEQIIKYSPSAVSVDDRKTYDLLKNSVGGHTKLLFGLDGLNQLASLDEADIVIIALSGAIGILPTLAAIKTRKRIALANKETLVAAGEIVMQMAALNNVEIIPVDSEHSAVFQCLGGNEKAVKNIWLTASGGPFKDSSYEELKQVTVEKALKHPNWSMGPKITIDSATMMNKGLEVIEAHHLFKTDYQQIKVVIQKESIIHSMVEFKDGSFLAHLGTADMRIPIQYALSYPERYHSPASHLDPLSLGNISFDKPDYRKFPALALAYHAGKTGGTLPAVMNAANEVAVHSFLEHRLSFTAIPAIVEKVMSKHENMDASSIDNILQADKWAREISELLISKGG
jgi:1-deoxy-D-xylulose-5-phosphate reductoisomerase